MMKKEFLQEGKKLAAVGLSLCFTAALVFTGVYTWKQEKQNVQEEQISLEEPTLLEERVKEANTVAKKAPVKIEEKAVIVEEKQVTEPASKTGFVANNKLFWPVEGNVLMSFSMDKSVYFETLEQYKYNPAMIISCIQDDNVMAAGAGMVKAIDEMRETGTTVTIDMGNGYECIYGQLQDINVKVGDYIQAKDVIGCISEPTKYYSVEGPNLYFEMRKDGQPVNPIDYLES